MNLMISNNIYVIVITPINDEYINMISSKNQTNNMIQEFNVIISDLLISLVHKIKPEIFQYCFHRSAQGYKNIEFNIYIYIYGLCYICLTYV